MILAAGLGTRLRPLTESLPKVMLPIAKDKPLLEHTLCLLRDQGFKEFIINLHHLPEKITGYFGNGGKLGVKISYSDESPQLMETGGALKKVADKLSDNFILLYGDQLHFFDFPKALAFHQKSRALATLILKRNGNVRSGEIAEMDPSTKKIINWHTRPHNINDLSDRFFINSGLYVLSKEILDYIPDGKPVRFDFEVIPILLKEQKGIYGFVSDGEIIDVGTPEKYQLAKEWYAKVAREA